MTLVGTLQIIIYYLIILALTKPFGVFLTRVYNGESTFLDLFGRPAERLIYKLTKVDPSQEMNWKKYAVSVTGFSLVSTIGLYAILRMQDKIPFLNPQNLQSPGPELSFNTAISFVTNTNWQSYGGETTMSYLSQMAGLTVQNFVSAAVGMSVAVVFIRGIARFETENLGNFWQDMTRSIVYVLLPLSFVLAIFFVSQGVVQNLRAYDEAALLAPFSAEVASTDENGVSTTASKTIETQTIAQGPVASQLAIKMLGTNGGGFFNANSAHPFENPTPLSNFVQMLLIFVIPAGFTYMLGRMTKSQAHGWAVFAAMSVLFFAGVFSAYYAESKGNPLFPAIVDQAAVAGNFEGKEVRFGVAASVLFATVTTDASCGAVNAMHSSFTPLGGLVPLINIQLGEVIFGGVGAGLYGMLIMVILSVFIAGLMVGRTPEYLGKKIEAFDVQMSMLYALIFPVAILGVAAVTSLLPEHGLNSLSATGAHGLSELIYAYSSAAANNGSAFAGLNANTPWYNTTLGLVMLAGRFLMIVPVLAIAGNLARKKYVAPSLGTFPVTSPLFTALLIGVVLIIGALTFFPVISLSPLLEHFQMSAGQTF